MRKILAIVLVILLFVMVMPLNTYGRNNLSVVTFVITPNSTSSYGDYLIDLQLTSDISINDYIYVNFPEGFVLPEEEISASYVTINGETAAKVVISSTILEIFSKTPLQKGTEIVIRIDKKAMIKNPDFSGNFSFLIGLSNESSPQSVSEPIVQGISHLSITVQPDTTNSPAMYLINFYTSQNGDLKGSNGDYITVSFPEGTSFDNQQISPSSILVNGITPLSVDLNNNILTIHLSNDTIIPANSFVSVQIMESSGIINPNLPGKYFCSVLTNKNPFFVNNVYAIKGTSIKNLLVVVNPRIQNANSELKISFITSEAGALEKGNDKIFIEFPEKFTFSKTFDFSKIKLNGVQCEGGKLEKNILSITVPADVNSGAVTLTISKDFGIYNPSIKGEYILRVYTSKDLTPVSCSVQIESSHITAPVVSLSNFGAGAISGYEITFYTGAGGALSKNKSTVTINFPESTILPESISPEFIKVNEVQLTTKPSINKNNNSLEVLIPLDINGEEKVRIEISEKAGIKNPDSGGVYTLSVFTSEETTPLFSTGYEISLLPKSFAKVVPGKPDGKDGYYITHPLVSLTAESPTDSNPAIYYYLDNNSPALYTGDKISIPDGIHSLFYYAIDHTGNKEGTVNSIKFKVDTTPPDITITSPASDSVNGSTVKLVGRTEENAVLQINGDNIPVKSDGSFETILTGNGKTVFLISSTDEAGNVTKKSISITFNSSPENPPSLTIVSPQDGTVVYSSSVVVTGKTDPDATVKVNGISAVVSKNGSFTVTLNVTPGQISVDVVASRNGQTTEKRISIKYTKSVSMKLQIGNKNAIVNGEVVSLDAPPVIVNSRTLVPLRFISESFGADIKWDPVLKIVQIKFEDTNIILQIGEKLASVNGKKVELDSPPQIINGRTMVPLRFIVESFKANVVWDPDTRTITITYP